MKRFLSLLLALCLLLPCLPALATDAATQTVDLEANGVTVTRCHLVTSTKNQRFAVDYPLFAAEDKELEKLLNDTVAAPIRQRCTMAEQTDTTGYEKGAVDTISSGYTASMDFPGLLSVEASFRYQQAGSNVVKTDFFWAVISLTEKRSLSLYELFTDSADTVDAVIRNGVFMQGISGGFLKPEITESDAVPMPNSLQPMSGSLRVIYAAGAISENARLVDLPWDELGLHHSYLMTGEAAPAEVAAVTMAPESVTATEEPVFADVSITATEAPAATAAPAAAPCR